MVQTKCKNSYSIVLAKTSKYSLIVDKGSEHYLPNALHIEKSNILNLLDSDKEASIEAEKDGIKLIYSMNGVPDQTYIDTQQNRKTISEMLIKYPALYATNK